MFTPFLGHLQSSLEFVEDACKQLDFQLGEANLGSGTGGNTFHQFQLLYNSTHPSAVSKGTSDRVRTAKHISHA